MSTVIAIGYACRAVQPIDNDREATINKPGRGRSEKSVEIFLAGKLWLDC
jgi:hypothetical protein